MAFDVEAVRAQFPILSRQVNGKPLVYLDSAASAQKPRAVIDAMTAVMEGSYANVHRGLHTLANETTDAYEAARKSVAKFINAGEHEIVFTKGGTEAINLVAAGLGASLAPGDEILLTVMEHHANIVPWHFLRERKGVVLKFVPVLDDGTLDLAAIPDLLTARTKVVALTQMSNVLGTINPVAEIARLAHDAGAKVLVDGAQAVAHFPVDVTALDADFYAFSGHKVFGPTGIGALYGKRELLEAMPPWQGGGNMIDSVSFDETSYAPVPHRLEAGTGHIGGVAGLRAALRYLSGLDRRAATAHEEQLTAYATAALRTVPGLRLIGEAPGKIGVLTFLLAGTDPIALAGALDQQGIAIRAGHHCAQPALAAYGLQAAARASLALYNTVQDVDSLVAALQGIQAEAAAS